MEHRIASFGQLEDLLRSWVSFEHPQRGNQYDLECIARLCAACLDNLKTNHPETLDDLADVFTDEQKAFMSRLAETVNGPNRKSN